MALAEPTIEDVEVSRTVELLGGRRTLHRLIRSRLEAHDLLQDGLPGHALKHLVDYVAILRAPHHGSMEKAVGISLRTYQRRMDALDRPLSLEQSGRTWKFAEILGRAMDVFGSQAEAEDWLERPAMALEQRKPIDLLSTPAGVESLEDHLTRLEYRRLHVTPLPPPLGPGDLVFWRLDHAKFALTWDSGEGSYRAGGRWSSRGIRAVYAALDPAAAILEVAVHKTFRTLDIVPHVLTSSRITDVRQTWVVTAGDIPNPNWLRPGAVSAGQNM